MKLTTPPQSPLSIRYDVVAAVKFEELCLTLIQLDKLSIANLGSIEVAASSYSSWIDAEEATQKNGYDSPSATHAHRYRTSYFVALGALGLARTPKDVKPTTSKPVKSKPAPIKVSEVEESAPSPARPKLKIYGRA